MPLRGNVPTRLRKLAEGANVDAIVLAAAGLTRLKLDLSAFAVVELPPEWWIPAPGQGALAAQCRAGDGEIEAQIAPARRRRPASTPRAGSANSCASSKAAARRLSAATWPATRAHLGIATERGWAARSIDLPQDLFRGTHNVTHSSAEPSPAASPSTPQKLPLARSAELYARAEALIPAGVSSPVRAFRKVGGTPVFFKQAQGAHAIDEDGNRYLDFCMAWGPLILGHAHPRVVEAVQRAAADGLAFGTAHRGEGELAERVLAAYPYAKLVRFVVSGTEAVATAVRIARASNGRRRILKFDGCYHGHVDSLMVKAGSGVITQGLADSAGVPAQVAADTLVIPLGDVAALEQAFKEQGKDIAAAIIEPLPANNGLLHPVARIPAEAARAHARATAPC